MSRIFDFNIRSGKADSKLLWDIDFQETVEYAIEELLWREPMGWTPDTIWIDADNNILHMWDANDRDATERTICME